MPRIPKPVNLVNSPPDQFRYPLYKTGIQNGKPGILFDGANDRMGFSAMPDLDGQVTMIVVMKVTDNGALQFPIFLCRASSDVYRLYFSVDTSGNNVNACVYDTGERVAGLPGDPSGANIYGMTNIEGSVISGYKNGVKTDGVVNTGTYGGTTTAYLGIWRDGTSYPFSGYLFEVLIYNRVLTTAELNSLWDYLGKKWGIECAGSPAGSPCGIADGVLWLDAARLPRRRGAASPPGWHPRPCGLRPWGTGGTRPRPPGPVRGRSRRPGARGAAGGRAARPGRRGVRPGPGGGRGPGLSSGLSQTNQEME